MNDKTLLESRQCSTSIVGTSTQVEVLSKLFLTDVQRRDYRCGLYSCTYVDAYNSPLNKGKSCARRLNRSAETKLPVWSGKLYLRG